MGLAGWMILHPRGRSRRTRLAAAVPPGSTAAVALIEHLWAEPLTAAIVRDGGRPLDETWLGPDDRRALETLLEARGAGRT